MKIPHEWVSEICNNLIRLNRMFPSDDTDYETIFSLYWHTDFNNAWDIKQDPRLIEIFKPFFIRIAIQQCNYSTHQFTCGIDSGHAFLVPRITPNGTRYLVCPICGYAEFHSP